MKQLFSQSAVVFTLAMIMLMLSSTIYGQRNAKQKQEVGEITVYNLNEEEGGYFAFKKAEPVEFVSVENKSGNVLAPVPFLQKRDGGQRSLYSQRFRNYWDNPLADINELSRIVYRTPNRVFGNDKFRHQGGQAVAFSPDSRYLVSGGRDQFLRFFNVQTGVQEKVLVGHTHAISSIAFVPGSNLVISAGGDLRVWDYKNELPLWVSELSANTLSVSPDGKHLLIDNKLFEIESKNPFKLNPVGKQLNVEIPSMSYFTDDNQYAIMASPSGGIWVMPSPSEGIWAWDIAENKSARLGAFSKTSIQLSDIANAFDLPSVENDKQISFSSSNYFVLTGDPEFLVQAPKVVGLLSRRQLSAYYDRSAVATSPNGRYIAGIGRGLGLWVFDMDENAFCCESETVDRKTTLTCSFSHDGKLIASGGLDGVVRIRNVESGNVIDQWDLGVAVYRVLFAPDQPLLAIGDGHGRILTWNLETKEQKTIPDKHARSRVEDMVFDSGTKTLAVTGNDARLNLVNYETGIPITFPCESSNCVAIDPVTGILMYGAGFIGEKDPPPNFRFLDMSSLLKMSGSDNPTQKNINFLPQSDEFRLRQLKSIDIEPTKRLLAATDWLGSINIWNLDEKKGIARLRSNLGTVSTILFIPGTSSLLTGGDGGVVVWDTESRKPTHILYSDSGAVRDISVYVSGEGTTLVATASQSGTIHIWDLNNLKK